MTNLAATFYRIVKSFVICGARVRRTTNKKQFHQCEICTFQKMYTKYEKTQTEKCFSVLHIDIASVRCCQLISSNNSFTFELSGETWFTVGCCTGAG